MAEVLVTYTSPVRSRTGDLYWPRALGRVADDGLWEGWLEFALAGTDEVARTARETEQPNRDDLLYWAEGLTLTYLEGALERALHPEPVAVVEREIPQFVDSAPRTTQPRFAGSARRPVLDPFQVYAEGEQILRDQLGALSRDHVQTIVEAYRFADGGDPGWSRSASQDALVERVVERVRARFAGTNTARDAAEEASPPSPPSPNSTTG